MKEIERYREADFTERALIAEKALELYSDKIAYLVYRMARGAEQDAMQAGSIGLIVALNRFDPKRNVPFWYFAKQYVAHEINKFLNCGYYWFKKECDPVRRKAKEGELGENYRHFQLGAEDPEDKTSAYCQYEARDVRRKLGQFLSMLGPKDCALLMSTGRTHKQENRDRREFLISEARKFMCKGDENEKGNR